MIRILVLAALMLLAPHLAVAQQVPPPFDLGVQVSAPAQFRACETVRFTVDVVGTNGPDLNPSNGVSLILTLPAGAQVSAATAGLDCTTPGLCGMPLPAIAPGGGQSFQLDFDLSGLPQGLVPLTLGAELVPRNALADGDQDDGNDRAEATSSALNVPPFDLELTAQATEGNRSALFDFLVTNAGPSTASGMSLVVQLQSGLIPSPGNFTCVNDICGVHVPVLIAGASTVLTLEVFPEPGSPLMQLSGQLVPRDVNADGDCDPSNNAASASASLLPPENFDLGLDVATVPTFQGSQVDFDLIVSNAGPGASFDFALVAELPPGVTVVSAPDFQCDGVMCAMPLPTLGPGAPFARTLALAPDPGASEVTLSAYIRPRTPLADRTDTNPDNHRDEATAVRATTPFDLSVLLTPRADPYRACEPIALDLVVAAADEPGYGPSFGVELLLPLPPQVGGAAIGLDCDASSCRRFPMPSLDPGERVSYTVVLDPPGGFQTFQLGAQVLAPDDQDPTNNSADALVTAWNYPHFEVAVDVAPLTSTASSGQMAVTVTNEGPNPSTQLFVHSDTEAQVIDPNGALCSNGSCIHEVPPLAVGESSTHLYVLRPADGGAVASLSSEIQESGPSGLCGAGDDNGSGSVTLLPVSPFDGAVEISAPARVLEGDLIAVEIKVDNLGPSPFFNYLLEVELPGEFQEPTPGLSCVGVAGNGSNCVRVLPDLLPGEFESFTVITAHPAGAAAVQATATIQPQPTFQDGDSQAANNTARATTEILPPFNLRVEKTGPETYAAGDQIPFEIAVTNEGPGASLPYTLVDHLPIGASVVDAPGFSCEAGICQAPVGAFAVGETVRFGLTVEAQVGVEALENKAEILPAAEISDLVEDDNRDMARSVLTGFWPFDGAVAIDAPAVYAPDEPFTVSMTVDSRGPADVRGYVLFYTLPAGTTAVSAAGGIQCFPGVCSLDLDRLAVGQFVGASVDLVAASSEESLHHLVEISPSDPANDADTNPTNNRAEADSLAGAIQPGPDLEVSLLLDPTYTDGEPHELALTVRNRGSEESAPGSLTVPIPAGLSIAEGASWVCGSEVCTRALPPYPVNGAESFALLFTVPDGFTDPILHQGRVNSPGDIEPANDEASAETLHDGGTVGGGGDDFDIEAFLVGPSDPSAEEVELHLTLLNHGPATTRGHQWRVGLSVPVSFILLDGVEVPCQSVPAVSVCLADDVVLGTGESETRVITIQADQLPPGAGLELAAGSVSDGSPQLDRDLSNNLALWSSTSPLGPQTIHDIPTLGGVGLLTLVLAMAGLAIRRMRSQPML